MRLNLLPLLVCVLIGSSSIHAVAGSDDSGMKASAVNQVPIPSLKKKIKFNVWGSSTAINQMVFSPDNRYLAIALDLDVGGKAGIVVWDLELDKIQSHILCPFNNLRGSELLWGRDSKTISFGTKGQWNPITGEALPDNPVIGGRGRLNIDGTKMLTVVGGAFVGATEKPYYIHIYDTQTWALLNEINADNLRVNNAEWTTENKILVAVSPTRETIGKAIDGRTITESNDTALRLFDPSGKDPIKAVWFPAEPTGDPKLPFKSAIQLGTQGVPIFSTNQIIFPTGLIVDGATLNVRRINPFNEKNDAPGAFGMGVSSDGRFLYLKGASYKYGGHPPIRNSIVDVESGKPLTLFDGGTDGLLGLAISPDGKHLALGGDHSQFFGSYSQTVLVFGLQ